MDDRPCCAAAAARQIKQLNIGGIDIGIANLDDIMGEVRGMGIQNDEDIGEMLLKKAKIYNYIPAGIQQAYRKALLERYKEGC